MKKLVRLAALSVMALSLTTGVAAASTGSIDTTGPDSYNKVEFKNRQSTRVRNNNHVDVGNVSFQSAHSGDASVKHNTEGGSARSGNASNSSSTSTSVGVNNGGSSAAALSGNGGGSNSGSIHKTGPDSYNKVSFNNSSYTSVKNNNHVGVLNLSVQKASSGDAKVYDNTEGGDATSGNASNTSTTSTTVNITN
jgi:hypothetical protein